jgi:cytochrome c biogenesis protein CcmG/thiol:disulfide interchange protein DsbE
MRYPLRWGALGVGVIVVAFAVVLASQVGNDPRAEQHRSRLLGKDAPAFDVAMLDGKHESLDELRGKAVIVNFWNSWCIPCRQELPALKEFYRQHANDRDFAMVGIVRDDTRRAVRKDVAREAIRWTIGFDPGSRAALDFGTRGQPETFAIAPDGVIAGSQYGPSTVGDLEAMLDAARRRV